MIGQAYDGAAVFSCCKTGVQIRMRVHSAHAVYVHCACHRLQMASMQAAEIILAINRIFTMMGNLWKLFYYSPKKAEALKEVQAALKFPQLKVVKPSSTRWLSHERCMRAISRELPAIIITLQQLHETTGDAEAFGLCTLLASFTCIASVMLLSEVLDILARMNATMQRKTADFSKLKIMIELTIESLEALKDEKSDWCSDTGCAVSTLQTEYGVDIGRHNPGSTRSTFNSINNIKAFRKQIDVPYIDTLIDNIKKRFSDEVVKLLVAFSIFNPSLLPAASTSLSS